jgi:hypothetical protein
MDGEIVTFLRRRVLSVVELQILLHLRRRRRASEKARTITKHIDRGADLVPDALERLAAWGLIAADPDQRWRYSADPREERTIAAIDEVYRANPGEIVRLMSFIAMERIRRSAIERFSPRRAEDGRRDEE